MSIPDIFISLLPLRKFQVVGRSMEPMFHEGNLVLVNRMSYIWRKPKVGDVVAVVHPKQKIPIIKRIEKMTEDGVIIKGDNREQSTDSRQLGVIPRKFLIGKVVARL